MSWRRFFSAGRSQPRGAPGWRAYAIGDIHGCLTELDDLVSQIAFDHAARPPAQGLIVFLGDVIDRGPNSRGVMERLRTFHLPGFRHLALAGNHEELLLDILDGDAEQVESWLRFGGGDTSRSYRLSPEALAALSPAQAQARIAAAIPAEHRQFLTDMADTFRFGDYLFVHAGIRPGVPITRQTTTDLHWIREPFLSDPQDHGVMVVHGHTISDGVDERPNRIGIDTGAYATGRLTAIGIDGAERWFLSTGKANG